MPTQYDITDMVKDAVKSVIASGQNYVPTAAIRTNRSDIAAVAPRIDVTVTNVSRASEQMASVNGSFFFNHFEVAVDVAIISDRAGNGAAQHDLILQRVRYLMSREAQSFVSPVVTLFEPLDIMESGESHEVKEETREDISTVSYRLPIGLLRSGYTVPTSGVLV
jgi:hypothetical protein